MSSLPKTFKTIIMIGVMGIFAACAQADTRAIDEIREFIKEKQADETIDTSQKNWRTRLPKFPEVKFDDAASLFWNLETNKGSMKFKLLPEVAPNHVASTIYLTELKFYDGLIFHRVISGFMAQGGCPIGSGRGNPGYRYEGEFKSSVRHSKPGLLSMANAGPNTDGSQFFITFVPTPHLNGRHTIFGEIVDGKKVLRTLERNGSRSGKPKTRLVIEKAWITTQ